MELDLRIRALRESTRITPRAGRSLLFALELRKAG